MEDKREDADGPNVIEGADAGALGINEPPSGAPPGASVDAGETQIPGPTFDGPDDDPKPWASSLAAESSQAGVGNMPPEEVEPQFPESDDEAL